MKNVLCSFLLALGVCSYGDILFGMKRKIDDNDHSFENKKFKPEEHEQLEVPDVIMQDFLVPIQAHGHGLSFELLLGDQNSLKCAIQNRHADMITFISSNGSEIQKLLLLRQKIESVVSELKLGVNSLKLHQRLALQNCYSGVVPNNDNQRNSFLSTNKEYRKASGLLRALENFLRSKNIILNAYVDEKMIE